MNVYLIAHKTYEERVADALDGMTNGFKEMEKATLRVTVSIQELSKISDKYKKRSRYSRRYQRRGARRTRK